MKIDQAQLDRVETKLNKQNALRAVFATAFWTMPFLTIWYFVYLYNPSFSPVMLLLSGFLVGFSVRIHGKGMTGLFSLIAIIVHSIIVLVAFSLNIVLVGTTWAFLLFSLYAAGTLAAKKVARIEVPFEEHRAYSFLTSLAPHASSKALKNSWFITLPTLLITATLSSYIAIISILFFIEYQTLSQNEEQNQQQKEFVQNKEIDITPAALDKRTNHEILLYSYAYHSGLRFNKRGMRVEVFPRSEYKALTILKYLVEHRDNARAKFILGFLTEGAKGGSLIQAAVEQNDKYARIHSAVSFGCYADENLANELLRKLRASSREEYIKQEIEAILYIGIKEACLDLEQPDFLLSYAKNYNES